MSNSIKIDLSRDKLTATIKVTGVDPITRDDILGALRSSGVVYGVFEDVVDIATSGNIDDFMIIARGNPPVEGKNGWVEILWKTEDREDHPDTEKTVDFRETSNLISVNEGALLAQMHPPQEGIPGKSVTGEVISPTQPKSALIVPGKGVKLDNSGDKVYAVNQGRPVAKFVGPNVSISVEPSFTVSGDVCLKTGNIRFKGDVIVTGSVNETMKLEASGNVTINGIITGAHVSCGKNLVIQRNIISSDVSAGIGAMESGKIRYLVQDLHDDMSKLLQAIEQLKRQSPDLGKLPYTQLVNSLLENRFRNIKGNTKQFLLARSFNLPFEVEEAVEAIKIITSMHFTPEDLHKIMEALLKALAVMGSHEAEKAKIQMGSASASTIKCSGDVVVLKGCVNTTIYASGNVKIKGHFKGGEIYCEGNAELDELGSTLGAPPLVRIKSKGFVRVSTTLPGSVIQIGSTRLNVTQELARSTFRLNSNDEIDIIPT
ncbi:MAG: FapA family protein [Firmicutes bacterium]|nr:FapA family protein [Bacillota bacterium]